MAVRLSSRLEDKIDEIPRPQGSKPFVGEILVRLLGQEAPPELLPEFSFVQREQYLRNDDIFKLHPQPDGTLLYVFHCPHEHYEIVRRKIKKAAKKGILEIASIKGVSGIPRKRSSQSKEYLLNVAAMLPKRRDWYKGIHKDLAQVIGISNNKANRLVTSILEDQQCLEALGKSTHSNLKANKGVDSCVSPREDAG